MAFIQVQDDTMMTLTDPQTTIAEITSFLRETFQNQAKTHGVIAVSGGIDSALSLTLLTSAIGPSNVFPIFLPYGEQSVEDSKLICQFNNIPEENISEIDIKELVDAFEKTITEATRSRILDHLPDYRKGNVMARMRMIAVYDLAKQKDALVCGTENKSEKYLGYFTRFGDEASDIEPLQHLYKTQVRQLVEYLKLPENFLMKEPSAGLWSGQTDENELGFSYEQADKVLFEFVDGGKHDGRFDVDGVDPIIVEKVIARVRSQEFKHHVPYQLGERS